MVEDGATWFSGRGAPTGDQVVSVEPSSRPTVGPVRSAPSAERVPLPTRTELWTAALRLWRLNAILGVGPDNFRHRYSEAVHPAGGGTFTDERMHANNLYFEVLADLGLAGLAALVLLICALARAALSASARADPLILLPLLAALTFFVHGTVDYFFEFTPTFGLWWLLMALAGRGYPEPAR
jgi:O-antigen ligase